MLIGLGISAIASSVYVIVWEVYLNSTDYVFIHEYAASYIEKKETSGVDGAGLAEIKDDMAKMVEQYDNPFFRLPDHLFRNFPYRFYCLSDLCLFLKVSQK